MASNRFQAGLALFHHALILQTDIPYRNPHSLKQRPHIGMIIQECPVGQNLNLVDRKP
jgi:hypothetical protein